MAGLGNGEPMLQDGEKADLRAQMLGIACDGDAKVFKKYSQMKTARVLTRRGPTDGVLSRFWHGRRFLGFGWADWTVSEIEEVV